jgi:Domain of unknown function (DUF4234)
MASELNVKRRDPLRSTLFDAFTLGIYGFYWHYATNRDLAELGRARGSGELGDNPTTSFLAALPGIFVLVPFFVSTYNTAERIRAAQRLAGVEEDVNSGLATVAAIPYPIAIYYLQKRLNRVWERELEGAAPVAA